MNICVLLSESLLISKMDLGEISCEDVRWIELAQYLVQWQALVLTVSKLCACQCVSCWMVVSIKRLSCPEYAIGLVQPI
jgi:hypothetical protein